MISGQGVIAQQPKAFLLLICVVKCFLCLFGLQVIDDASANKDTVINLGKPGVANHVLTLQPGEVVELVIQNNRAGLFGGEYNTSSALTSNRNGREQHSFHLHGHHFWQVGGCWVGAAATYVC